jgi:hypothetical protein
MNRSIDDGALTAEQRLTAIARILAGALLHLRDRAALPSGAQPGLKIPLDSVPISLEVPDQSRLSVSTRVSGFRDPKRSYD